MNLHSAEYAHLWDDSVSWISVVQGIVLHRHITGSIRSREGDDVQVIAGGLPADPVQFKLSITIEEYPMQVEIIDISEEPYTGEYLSLR